MKVHQFIEKNEKQLLKLIRLGTLNGSLIVQYYIYKDYHDTRKITSKMQRYSIVAEKNRISERTVMKSIKEMEKNM